MGWKNTDPRRDATGTACGRMPQLRWESEKGERLRRRDLIMTGTGHATGTKKGGVR